MRGWLVVLVVFAGCGTFRVRRDAETEALTGVRTMRSTSCAATADCIANAVKAANRDCESDGKYYEFVSHSSNGFSDVSYRCVAPNQTTRVFLRTRDGRVISPKGRADGESRCSESDLDDMKKAGMSASAIDVACNGN